MTEHTDLPWSIDDDGDTLYIWADAVKDYVAAVKEFGWSASMQANAEFIVKAVNNHDDLIRALTSIAGIADNLQGNIAREALLGVVGRLP